MLIVVGFLRSPEGQAAVERAVEEAQLRDAELLVVHSARGGGRDETEELRGYHEALERLEEDLERTGIRFRVKEYVRGNSPSEDLLLAAEEEDADLLVIGLRRRSPVGKLVLGSNAQDVLLQADCAVLTVKGDRPS